MKKTGIWMITILCALAVNAGCTGEADDTPVNTPQPTKETQTDTDTGGIPSQNVEHGKLLSCKWQRYGGMENETTSFAIGTREDGTLYAASEKGWLSQATLVSEYEASQEDLDRIGAYIDKYNLCAWEDLPESEYEVLDAPSEGIRLQYDDCDFYISYELELPENGREILEGLETELMNLCTDEKRTDSWYLNEMGDPVILSRDNPLDEYTIDMILGGYWYLKYERVGETETENLKDGTLSVQNGNITPAGIESLGKDGGEYPYQIFQQPYKDYDCPWYIQIDNSPICGVIEGGKLILESETAHGLCVRIFER